MNIQFDAYLMEDALMMLLPMLTSAVPSGLLTIAAYVLSSMALYTMAERRGIQKSWISWVPVFNVWIIGSLSDQYRYVVKGEYKSKRKIMLLISLLNLLIGLTMMAVCIFVAVDVVGSAIYGVSNMSLARMAMGPVFGVLGLALPMAGLSVALAVIRYIALYDIYRSADPSNAILFLVLSVLFRVTEPFFLFFIRNRDEGMPPRREEPGRHSQEPVCEAWEDDSI